MKRKLINGEHLLLTESAVEGTVSSGLNYLIGTYDNTEMGHTTAHVSLYLTEGSGTAIGEMLYVYLLHDTPGGLERGSTSYDPSHAAIGAIAAKGTITSHRVCIDAPIRRKEFKVLLRNEWGDDVDFQMHVETSSKEIVE